MNRNGKFQIATDTLVKAGLLAAISIVLTRVFSIMIPLGGIPALRLGFGSLPIMIAGLLFGPIVGGLTGVVADLIGVMLNPMGGSFFPGFTLSAAMNGILAGLLFQTFKIHKKKLNYNIANAIVILMFLLIVIGIMVVYGVITFENGKPVYSEPVALFVISIAFIMSIIFMLIPAVQPKKLKLQQAVYGYDKIAFAVTLDYLVISLGMNTQWLSMMYSKGALAFFPGRIVAAIAIIPIYTFILFTLSRLLHFERLARK
jgi:ECF transporter S component (folate family)